MDDDPPPIKGLKIIKNSLSKEYCDVLFEWLLESDEYKSDINRETIMYGFKYDYSIREPQTRVLEIAPPPPKILQNFGDLLYKYGFLSTPPNQIIINKYLPGQGIGKHRDHHPIFADGIATLSLGSGVYMDFERYGRQDVKASCNDVSSPISVYLSPGDLVVMTGDARYAYSHEIKKRKSDLIPSTNDTKPTRVNRGVRISVTFRHVIERYRGES